jgi:hypothetical protein
MNYNVSPESGKGLNPSGLLICLNDYKNKIPVHSLEYLDYNKDIKQV